jgi:hypothetical protein
MVLRSMYLDPKIDAELAARAEDEGTTKADLMRRFLVEGLSRPATMFSGYATASGAKDARSAVATTVPMARAARAVAPSSPPAIPMARAAPRPPGAPSRPAPAAKKKEKVSALHSRRDVP